MTVTRKVLRAQCTQLQGQLKVHSHESRKALQARLKDEKAAKLEFQGQLTKALAELGDVKAKFDAYKTATEISK